MIELKNVSAGYDGKTVVRDADVTFERGKITMLVGPNGCGKSTLLKSIVGIVPCIRGDVIVGGVFAKNMNAKQLAKTTAYLAQSKKAPDISVMKMVLHGRFPHLGYPRKYRLQDIEIAKRAISWAGLETETETLVSKLSGGMQQKVYIAMALAQDTDVILMDEPTTYLDVAHQLRLMEMVKNLAKEGKTIVMVLHDLTQAMQIADKIVVMKEGTIISQGSPEDIYANKSLEEAFGVKIQKLQTEEGENIWHYSHFL